LPSDAVKVVLAPSQIVRLPEIVAVGRAFTTMVFEIVDLHPFSLVISTM
jgi:hypothetical protein